MFARALLTLFMCLFSIIGYAQEKASPQKATSAPIAKSSKTFRLETSVVSVIKLNGSKYHVADYPDGTRVITCLDGSLKGLQEVYFEGKRIHTSIDVEWHSKYFVHKYKNPDGKVVSYPNKQIAEIR